MTSSPEKMLSQIAIYLRKSRADLEAEARGEGETLSKHRNELIALAKKRDYSIAKIYEELVSGERIVDRPQMQAMLHAISAGEIPAVLCIDIDRLGRGNKIDQGIIQETFRDAGCLIITPRKTYNLSDETDEEFLDFESFLAHRELRMISRRMQRGKRQSVAQGKHIASQVPYGYQRQDGTLTPDPTTGPILQQIYAWALEGQGRVQICHRLEDLGIPSPRGMRHWDHSTLLGILTNPVYIGHLRWNAVRRKKVDGRQLRLKPTVEMTWHRNAHAPLISEEDWLRVQDLQHRHPPVAASRSLQNPFAGLLYCARCGGPVRRSLDGRKPRFKCMTHRCPTKSARQGDVEAAVYEALRRQIPLLEAGNLSQTREDEAQAARRILEAMTAQLATIDAQRNRLHDLLEQGVYTVDVFVEREAALQGRRQGIQSEIQQVDSRLARLSGGNAATAAGLHAVLDAYAHGDAAQQNHLLRRLVEKIVYTREPEWTEVGRLAVDVYLRL